MFCLIKKLGKVAILTFSDLNFEVLDKVEIPFN